MESNSELNRDLKVATDDVAELEGEEKEEKEGEDLLKYFSPYFAPFINQYRNKIRDSKVESNSEPNSNLKIETKDVAELECEEKEENGGDDLLQYFSPYFAPFIKQYKQKIRDSKVLLKLTDSAESVDGTDSHLNSKDSGERTEDTVDMDELESPKVDDAGDFNEISADSQSDSKDSGERTEETVDMDELESPKVDGAGGFNEISDDSQSAESFNKLTDSAEKSYVDGTDSHINLKDSGERTEETVDMDELESPKVDGAGGFNEISEDSQSAESFDKLTDLAEKSYVDATNLHINSKDSGKRTKETADMDELESPKEDAAEDFKDSESVESFDKLPDDSEVAEGFNGVCYDSEATGGSDDLSEKIDVQNSLLKY
ncbi:uncharacterized protein LOC119690109 [Teleopsis dalmanni]|uniref:uncharacterized protein LOC119690109 n=1 Tax=Teleopsis dalmanni TaxID=139649 RepID=UPI0018CF28F3|nr:uncharacterized protein LOC119690109 [Teleopsis dalmanni]